MTGASKTHGTVIRYYGTAGMPGLNPDPPPEGAFLESYDNDARDGRGVSTWTLDPAKALRFPDVRAAFACWREQSTVRPLRPDGKPNKPLTAFTIMVEAAP